MVHARKTYIVLELSSVKERPSSTIMYASHKTEATKWVNANMG